MTACAAPRCSTAAAFERSRPSSLSALPVRVGPRHRMRDLAEQVVCGGARAEALGTTLDDIVAGGGAPATAPVLLGRRTSRRRSAVCGASSGRTAEALTPAKSMPEVWRIRAASPTSPGLRALQFFCPPSRTPPDESSAAARRFVCSLLVGLGPVCGALCMRSLACQARGVDGLWVRHRAQEQARSARGGGAGRVRAAGGGAGA